MLKKKTDKERNAENEALERIISKKIDAIFQPHINKINSFFNRLKQKNKYLIIGLIFTILFILTYKQWKQIAQ
jgi:hypothetical protein